MADFFEHDNSIKWSSYDDLENKVRFPNRRKHVYFRAIGLKPYSNVRVFLDDIEVTDFTQTLDVIRISTESQYTYIEVGSTDPKDNVAYRQLVKTRRNKNWFFRHYFEDHHFDHFRSDRNLQKRFIIRNPHENANLVFGRIEYVEAFPDEDIMDVYVFADDPSDHPRFKDIFKKRFKLRGRDGKDAGNNTVTSANTEVFFQVEKSANTPVIGIYTYSSPVLDWTYDSISNTTQVVVSGKFINANNTYRHAGANDITPLDGLPSEDKYRTTDGKRKAGPRDEHIVGKYLKVVAGDGVGQKLLIKDFSVSNVADVANAHGIITVQGKFERELSSNTYEIFTKIKDNGAGRSWRNDNYWDIDYEDEYDRHAKGRDGDGCKHGSDPKRYRDISIVNIDELKSDSTGTLCGVIHIPSALMLEEKSKDGEIKFHLHGRHILRFSTEDSGNTADNVIIDGGGGGGKDDGGTIFVGAKDLGYAIGSTPLSQTIYVDEKLHPQGIYATGVKLLFRAKDDYLPVQVQLRPVINGIPSMDQILPGGIGTIDASLVNTIDDVSLSKMYSGEYATALGTGATAEQIEQSSNPFANTDVYTKAVFSYPVKLEPAVEYAVSISTTSPKYQVFVSDVGQKLVGTDRLISTQPYLGVLFKAQNSSVWEPFPNQDLCFQLMKAKFKIDTPTTVDFTLREVPDDLANTENPGVIYNESTAPTTNISMDALFFSSKDIIPANTKVNYTYSTTIKSSGQKVNFKELIPEETIEFDDNLGRRVITPNNQSMIVRASISSTNEDITPLIDILKMNIISIENLINNGGIANSDIRLEFKGQDYSNAAQVAITIAGGGGTGATATANVVNGQIDKIYITNSGSGYTSSPSITISKDSTATINAAAVIVGEDQPYGGTGYAKYIIRRVTLANGFDGGDLRVIFSAYKPRNTEIDVYYKVLSADDADSFENKRWKNMTPISGINSYSLNKSDVRNYMYAPGTNNTADNYISYDGFTTFKYFAVKVVMRSTDETNPPKISNFKAIALSELINPQA